MLLSIISHYKTVFQYWFMVWVKCFQYMSGSKDEDFQQQFLISKNSKKRIFFCLSHAHTEIGEMNKECIRSICLNPKHQMVTAICFSKLILQDTLIPPWACQHPRPQSGDAKSPSWLSESYLHLFKCYLLPAVDSDPNLLLLIQTYPFQQASPEVGAVFLYIRTVFDPSHKSHFWPGHELAMNLPKHLIGAHSNVYS